MNEAETYCYVSLISMNLNLVHPDIDKEKKTLHQQVYHLVFWVFLVSIYFTVFPLFFFKYMLQTYFLVCMHTPSEKNV